MNFWQFYFVPPGEHWWQGAVWGNILASALLSVSILFTLYKTRFKCAKCWRPSHHPVKNTHLKTCHKHATLAWHSKIERDFADKHPETHKFLKDNA